MVTESADVHVDLGGAPISVLRRGSGKPIVVLHDELGFPGWLQWNDRLGVGREFIAPLQPGFGRTPRVTWLRDYRDLASLYLWLVRKLDLGPVDLIGFSAGGFVAAEMATMSPSIVDHLVLVGPLGLRPLEGEFFDFLAVTMTTHLAATVSRRDIEETGVIYGGSLTPEQYALFEAARGETSRLGWEPFMFDPSLGFRLGALEDVETLVVWGEDDLIVPRGAVDAYMQALPKAQLVVLPGVGHRPEIEDVDGFVACVAGFLDSTTPEVR